MSPHPRHVLITGGSRGIGLAIARLFAKNSYRCTLISRSEDNLKAAIATLPSLPADQLQHGYIAGDITQGADFWTSYRNSAFPVSPRDATEHPSRIDVLVNCAGVTQAKLFQSVSAVDAERIIATNLSAVITGTGYLMRKSYLRGPKRSRDNGVVETKQLPSPSIVNVSSLLALKGGYGATAYAASKAGLLGFTRALAAEYASHRVRVNAIVPGYVDTDMTESLNKAELCKQIPLGRFGTAEEIASAALFLAENEYAHNCVLGLDGGLSAV